MENVKQGKKDVEAIVLAGGMGTRLRSVIQDIPKPMAPVSDQPFLNFILEELLAQGLQRVVLSTGYKHEVVEEYYQDNYKGLEIAYSVEDSPLGTGGAIKKALQQIRTDHAFVLNGDTLFKADLQEMKKIHFEHKADMTMALKKMEDCQRYGIVETRNQKVIRFREKMESSTGGAINGGIYLLKKELLESNEFPEKFSFEKDFMETHFEKLNIVAYESDAYFIDIGIPEDYEKAQRELMIVS